MACSLANDSLLALATVIWPSTIRTAPVGHRAVQAPQPVQRAASKVSRQKLGKVASVQALLVVEIDELAISGCAAERQSILAALKMATLQDAVRSFAIFKPLS